MDIRFGGKPLQSLSLCIYFRLNIEVSTQHIINKGYLKITMMKTNTGQLKPLSERHKKRKN